jgi:hypothetical protein
MENQTSGLLCSELPAATDAFCGRTMELLAIEEALDPTKQGQKGIVLCGIGGSGKTQLALRYIEQHQQFYTAILWINASTVEHTKQSFAEVADIISSNWPSRDLPLTYTVVHHPTHTCTQRTPSPKLAHRTFSIITQPYQRLQIQFFSVAFRISIRIS